MSRTFRYIPKWARREPGPYYRTYVALGFWEPYQHDPRCAVLNGYDGGHHSLIYVNPFEREHVSGAAAKWYKRQYHQKRRRNDKVLIRRELIEFYK